MSGESALSLAGVQSINIYRVFSVSPASRILGTKQTRSEAAGQEAGEEQALKSGDSAGQGEQWNRQRDGGDRPPAGKIGEEAQPCLRVLGPCVQPAAAAMPPGPAGHHPGGAPRGCPWLCLAGDLHIPVVSPGLQPGPSSSILSPCPSCLFCPLPDTLPLEQTE